jgi:hypothetical protein
VRPVIRLLETCRPVGWLFQPFLPLEQQVTVDRTGKSFTIPTWTGIKVGIKPRRQLGDGVRALLQNALGQFLGRTKTMTPR